MSAASQEVAEATSRLMGTVNELRKTETIYPAQENILNALGFTAPEDVRVAILGQDPYHGPNQAMGLSFSVPRDEKLPPSLRNIYKEMVSDIGCSMPESGDLTSWAQQGVLLLNTTLTVREHAANSHAKLGWQILTNHVIEQCFMLRQPVVFLAWGRHAVTLVEDARSRAAGKGCASLETKHILKSTHPPLFPQISRVGNCAHLWDRSLFKCECLACSLRRKTRSCGKVFANGRSQKPFNRVSFAARSPTARWLRLYLVVLFLMNKGIAFLWQMVPGWIGSLTAESLPILSQGPFGFVPFPLIVCVLGGLLIGLYAKHTGIKPEDLNVVMAKVKKTGRYDYRHIGKLSLAALLPLLFGGSVGPEAGLTGVIAGLCTWVGDRMRRFGSDFRTLTIAGTQAALTAVFTAPFYGFVAPLSGTADGSGGEESITLPKAQKAVVYLCAIAGALGAFLVLGQLFGESSGLPRFDAVEVGSCELLLLLPLAIAGMACGWVFHAAKRHSVSLKSIEIVLY